MTRDRSEFVTKADAARILGVPLSTVREMLGREILFPVTRDGEYTVPTDEALRSSTVGVSRASLDAVKDGMQFR